MIGAREAQGELEPGPKPARGPALPEVAAVPTAEVPSCEDSLGALAFRGKHALSDGGRSSGGWARTEPSS